MECLRCGTCCVAPDIATLGKGVGVACRHLLPSGLCSIYIERPSVCRGYRPDEICHRIAASTLEERVKRYRQIFSL